VGEGAYDTQFVNSAGIEKLMHSAAEHSQPQYQRHDDAIGLIVNISDGAYFDFAAEVASASLVM
jgi:hypothetical protein